MDGDRFDTLTRTIGSRRALVAAIAGGFATLLGGGTAAAAPCPKGKKRCRRRCIARRHCCTTANCRPATTGRVCRKGRCTCPAARPKRCGDRCLPAASCCSSAECPAGTACSAAGVCVCPAESTACGGRCGLPEGAPCTMGNFQSCCSQTCDFLVGGGTCASCRGRSCSSTVSCCGGLSCVQGTCGGCRPRATSCGAPGDPPCCNSDCTSGACLSAANGRCVHDADCRACYLGGQCAGACVGGLCQV